MKKLLILCLLLAFSSCGPKNEEVTNDQIDTGSREEALDSVTDTQKDVVQTDEYDTTTSLPDTINQEVLKR